MPRNCDAFWWIPRLAVSALGEDSSTNASGFEVCRVPRDHTVDERRPGFCASHLRSRGLSLVEVLTAASGMIVGQYWRRTSEGDARVKIPMTLR